MVTGISLTAWVRQRDGIAHSRQARDAGFSDREMADAVRHGILRRVRRSWLVDAHCHPARVAAARVGGRATCVSAAVMVGLWVRQPDHDAVHVAVPHSTSRVATDGLVLHWAAGPEPTSRLETLDPILNVLFHIARCLDQRDALVVWESALNKGLVTGDVLLRVEWRSRRAEGLARVASAVADSGLETIFIDRMRPYGIAMRQQVWIEGHPVDVLVGERLVIQIDGFEHHRSAKERRRDITHDARLALRGFTVLRFDYVQILYEWDSVVGAVRTALAQGLHRAQRVPQT